MTYSFWPSVGEHLCAYDAATQTCDWESYGLKVGLAYGGPGVVIALLAIVMGLPMLCVYCACRCCCKKKCCRYLNLLNLMNTEICIRSKWGKKKRYCFENGVMCRFAFGVVIVLTLLCVLVAMGLDVDVNIAHLNWKDESKDFIDNKVDDLQNTVDTLRNLQINNYLSEDTQRLYGEVTNDLQQFQGIVHTVYDYATNILITKFSTELTMMFGWILACIGAITTILFVRRNYGLVSQTCSFIVMLVFVSCLLSFTLVSQSLYNDVCIDNDISIAGGNSALMYGILPCNDIANNLKDLNTAEEEALNYTCSYIDEACNTTSYPLYCFNITSNCNLSTVLNVTDHMITTDTIFCGDAACPQSSALLCNASPSPNTTVCYQGNLTVTECASSCLNSDLQSYANSTVELTQETVFFYDTLESTVRPLLHCNFVGEYAQTIKYDLCTRMLRVQWVALCLLFAEVGFIISLFLGMLVQNAVLEHRDMPDSKESELQLRVLTPKGVEKAPPKTESTPAPLFIAPISPKTMPTGIYTYG